jgi:hypothetical protein
MLTWMLSMAIGLVRLFCPLLPSFFLSNINFHFCIFYFFVLFSVPNNPVGGYRGQTLFFFTGLEDSACNCILQPVVWYGSSAANPTFGMFFYFILVYYYYLLLLFILIFLILILF